MLENESSVLSWILTKLSSKFMNVCTILVLPFKRSWDLLLVSRNLSITGCAWSENACCWGEQREKDSLTLDNAVQLTKSPDLAQRNMYVLHAPKLLGTLLPWWGPMLILHLVTVMGKQRWTRQQNKIRSAAVSRSVCYFCRNPRHPHLRCPTRNAVCYKCGKKVHFSKICRAQRSTNEWWSFCQNSHCYRSGQSSTKHNYECKSEWC